MILRGSFYSKMLEMETNVAVIAPTRMGKGQDFRIAYILHGLYSGSGSLLDFTLLPVYAQQYNCVFVLPEVGRSFYMDMVYGQKYFSYVQKELPAVCKNLFNISAAREDTAVIGTSMGGYGALKMALTQPEEFGYCCALASGCLFLKDFLPEMRQKGDDPAFINTWGAQFITDFRAAFGEGLEWKPEYEVMELAKRVAADGNGPRIYAACGTEDELLGINRQFRDEMRALPLDFTYEEWQAGHDWAFFDEALKRALRFIAHRQ